MAPVTPRTAFPKVLIERDSDSEQSSSEEEEEEEKLDEEEEEEEVGVSTANEKAEKLDLGSDANRKGKAPITISLKKVCKVTLFNLLFVIRYIVAFFFVFFFSRFELCYRNGFWVVF